MTYRTCFIAALFAISLTGAFAAQAADCKALSGKLLDQLDRGDYTAAVSDFNDAMKVLTPDKLKSFWQSLPEKWGARGARDEAKLVQQNGNDIVVTALHFASKAANAVVVCSPSGQIAGFHVFPQP